MGFILVDGDNRLWAYWCQVEIRYSQYEEDDIIADFFGNHVGTFLDIGAADGVRNSNTRALALKGWKGCLVEPLSSQFIALTKLYGESPGMILVNAAVSGHGNPAVFHTGSEGQLSTASVDIPLLPHMSSFFTNSYWVATLNPHQLLSIIGETQLDFVSLDCEGLDLQIASQSEDLFKSVRLLCYESDKTGREPSHDYDEMWRRVLARQGFHRVVAKTRGNTLVAR